MYDRDHLGEPNDDGEPELKSLEDAADRFGLRVALVVTCASGF